MRKSKEQRTVVNAAMQEQYQRYQQPSLASLCSRELWGSPDYRASAERSP